jgi:hypothetical protein
VEYGNKFRTDYGHDITHKLFSHQYKLTIFIKLSHSWDFICSLLGHVIISTNQLQQNWLERTISFILGRLVTSLFKICNLKNGVIWNSLLNFKDMSVGTSWNILRPETVESLFYLWRLTGNKTYQEWGWNIFQAFEKNSRIESGYVGLKDVSTPQFHI